MKFASPKLFYLSLAYFILSLLAATEVKKLAAAAVTRDFNFPEPLAYGLIIIQAIISLAGGRIVSIQIS